MSDHEENATRTSRRKFLASGFVAAGEIFLTGLFVLRSGLLFLFPKSGEKEYTKYLVGKVKDIPVGKAKEISFADKPVFVTHLPEGFKVFSGVCPLFKVVILTLFFLAILSILSVISPPGLGEPTDSTITHAHIKPEWYFIYVYFVLKVMPVQIGMSVLMILGLLFVFWPFIDEFFRKRIPNLKIHYFVGSAAIIMCLQVIAKEILFGSH